VAGLLVAAGLAGADDTHTLQGFVIDQSGDEVPGAVLTLEGADLTVEADDRGTFRFEAVPAGTYGLSVRASCEVTAHISELTIPRPIRVPLPVKATRFDCEHDEHVVAPDDQAVLVAMTLHASVRTGRHPLVAALLGDGAIRLELHPMAGDPDLTPSEILLEEGQPVPLHPVVPAAGGGALAPDRSGAMVLRFCLMGDDDRVHVRIRRTTAPMSADTEMLWASEALLTFRRDPAAETGWQVEHQLFCLEEAPPGVPAPDDGSPPSGTGSG